MLGHGRIEVRCLTASSALADYLDWPGLQQVFEIERTVTRKRTGQVRRETVYGITSLPPQRADAARLLNSGPPALGHRKQVALGARCDLR